MAKRNAPGRLIDAGGHRLHAIVEGQGPTVVLDHGAGGNALLWELVARELAKEACVVRYDRAGYGWSEKGQGPRTNEQGVEELRALLRELALTEPVVLVGHSFAGISARLFASRYPEEVAGVVLVDATHEDELTDRFPAEHVKGQQAGAKMMKSMAGLAKSGILPLLAKWKLVPGIRSMIAKFSPETQAHLWRVPFTASAMEAAYLEFSSLQHGYDQVRAHGPHALGDLPLAVIQAGLVSQYPPGASEAVKARIREALHEVAVDMANLSTKGKLVIAENSGHNVFIDQPEVVVEAVRDVLAQIREKGYGKIEKI